MRILVVEDSPPARDLVRRSLEDAGHEVTLASRVSTGLRLATSAPFEVIVLDVMLPDGDGLALCRTLRARGVQTPILFLTARGEVHDRISGLDAGADDYLRKPFALAELHARIRALGRRQGVAAPARLESGAIRIDFAARRLERAGQTVPLTGREWAVLEVLAARAGRVVPRHEVLDAAWPEPHPTASESLDVIVSRLRRKLGQSEEQTWIRTVRGEGYVFEVTA
jgi:two-component system copper resistance phosphate regulon response regulator CusR